MIKTLLKRFLILSLVFQFYVFIGSHNDFFEISLLKTIEGVTLFLIPAIYGTDIVNIIKTRSLDTLFFMNTTLLMACLDTRDGIYNNLIKGSIDKIKLVVDGYEQ